MEPQLLVERACMQEGLVEAGHADACRLPARIGDGAKRLHVEVVAVRVHERSAGVPRRRRAGREVERRRHAHGSGHEERFPVGDDRSGDHGAVLVAHLEPERRRHRYGVPVGVGDVDDAVSHVDGAGIEVEVRATAGDAAGVDAIRQYAIARHRRLKIPASVAVLAVRHGHDAAADLHALRCALGARIVNEYALAGFLVHPPARGVDLFVYHVDKLVTDIGGYLVHFGLERGHLVVAVSDRLVHLLLELVAECAHVPVRLGVRGVDGVLRVGGHRIRRFADRALLGLEHVSEVAEIAELVGRVLLFELIFLDLRDAGHNAHAEVVVDDGHGVPLVRPLEPGTGAPRRGDGRRIAHLWHAAHGKLRPREAQQLRRVIALVERRLAEYVGLAALAVGASPPLAGRIVARPLHAAVGVGERQLAGVAARGQHHGLRAHGNGSAARRTGSGDARHLAALLDKLFDLRVGVQRDLAGLVSAVLQARHVVAAALLALLLHLDGVTALP